MIPVSAVTVLLLVQAPVVAVVWGITAGGTVVLVSGALDAVVDVALYHYAADGTVLGAFAAADLDGMYGPKRRRLGF
jgi:hypothetical protein